nr:TPA_asm: hypothetical protein HUJ06_006384 [Nelumbo nucifera]
MERDFLGLNSKESVALVKEEIKDAGKNAAFMRGPGMQWPFSNKVSALPHFMPFKAGQDDRAKKIIFDPFASGFIPTIATADAFDANKQTSGIAQKSFNFDRQGGTHYAMAAYPLQHVDAHATNHPPDVRMFPANQTISIAMNNLFIKTQNTTMGQNMAAATMKQQPLGGIPVATAHSILPTAGSMARTFDPWNISKPAGAPAQLTIFYAGAVNVYNDITPEKAQAIMFFAGNGSPMTNPIAQVQTPTAKPVAGDGLLGNQLHPTSPCSGLSSPISVNSHASVQSGSGSSSTDDLASRQIGNMNASSCHQEPQNRVASMGSAAPTLMPAAVPQARKASLARFLEKRKER